MNMRYEGRYTIFDPNVIQTCSLSSRTNKVMLKDLLPPQKALKKPVELSRRTQELIDEVARDLLETRKAGRPVLLFTGAHLIKNGLSLLILDLVEKGLFTLVAGNGATAIHDFELALIGQTSEYVPQALEKGQFGMASEFAYINEALRLGDAMHLGYGESLGRMICDPGFRERVPAGAAVPDGPPRFEHPDVSLLAACWKHNVPFTVHVGVGTDVIDQHPGFDGRVKGGCSGRDFLIYTDQVCRLKNGGMVFNIGSAVTGPEVLLKAVSMASNSGSAPAGILTADFDLRPYDPAQCNDESAAGYYFRDQKSVVTRIPQAFGGKGRYIQGDQKETILSLYQTIMHKIK